MMKRVTTIQLNKQIDISLAHAIFDQYIWNIDAVVENKFRFDAKDLLKLLMTQGDKLDIYINTDCVQIQEMLREELDEWRIRS